MSAARARRSRAPPFLDPPGYARLRPEATLLYQLVEHYYAAFRALRAEAGRPLPKYVQEEFDANLKCGLIERDIENAWLVSDSEAGALDDLIGHSITYRIAVGPRAGQKLFTLQTLPARLPALLEDPNGAARACGFSLHAGVDIAPHQREKLERLCRYVSRPPLAVDRLVLTPSGQVRYTLKTAYRDGTTHIVLEPLDFMARLAALVPPPRMHLTRFHGVFAPHSSLRAAITPAGRGRGKKAEEGAAPPVPRHVARILAHLDRTCDTQPPELAPLAARPPPLQSALL